MKEPRISVVATEELHQVLLQAAAALRTSRKKGAARSPAVLNTLIVQVSTARGTWEHAQKAAAAAAKPDGVQAV
jgi:hypothetical protein